MPVPGEARLSPLGRDLDKSINSRVLFAGSAVGTATTKGMSAHMPMGSKSRRGLQLIGTPNNGLLTSPPEVPYIIV